MKHANRNLILWELAGGLLLFASFWISRWGRCSISLDAPEWYVHVLYLAPIVIAIIFFGRIRTLFFLVLNRFFGVAIPEDITDTWDFQVILLVGAVGFAFVFFSSC